MRVDHIRGYQQPQRWARHHQAGTGGQQRQGFDSRQSIKPNDCHIHNLPKSVINDRFRSSIMACGTGCNYERASGASSYVTSGASSFVFKGKSEYSRPDPARPDPITLFKVLYLRNRMSDRQAGFFDEYHLDVKVVWHGYHIASVPVMARGACQTWGTLDDPKNILPH